MTDALRIRNELVAVGIARRNYAKQKTEIRERTFEVLRKAEGHLPIAEVARLLGMNRSTVYRMYDEMPLAPR